MSEGESRKERLDRELMELLQELRVVIPGVQVLLAFLLTAPFQQRFAQLPGSMRNAFFASIVCATLATAFLIAPSAHHRLRWRAGEKERLVRVATRWPSSARCSWPRRSCSPCTWSPTCSSPPTWP